MASEYKKYLEQIHSKLEAPDSIIKEITEEATGGEVISKRKIIAGEANEVYDLTLLGDAHVIARISRKDDEEFEREQWCIEKCHELGVPVSRILLLKKIEVNDEKLSICVQEKIDGEPLERGAIHYGELDEVRLRKIINQAGELLGKIHSVSVDGFGKLNAIGHAPFKTYLEYFRDDVGTYEQSLWLAEAVNLDKNELRKVFDILQEEMNQVSDIPAVLTHNDFAPKHIMVKGEAITGILDWGEASGNSPVNDFAKWAKWYPDIPLDWLKEGYPNKKLFEGNFDSIVKILKLKSDLGSIYHYYKEEYTEGVERAKERLIQTLKSINV